MDIKLPVRLTDQLEIVDANGRTIIPTISWQADFYHLRKQKEIGEYVVGLLNMDYNDKERGKFLETVQAQAQQVTPPLKRRGRPPRVK